MNLSSFDFNLLRVLDALLSEGSTVKAGVRIGLSQPAVSAALGRLRAQLNDPLFVRQGQQLKPTDFALSLEIPLRNMLEEMEVLLSGATGFEPATVEATMRISGTDFFAELLMPELARQVQKQAPGLKLQLVDLVPDVYVDTLERYQVDIALLPEMHFADWIGRQHVLNCDFVVVARQGHEALQAVGVRRGDVIPLELFCGLGHILMSPEGKLRGVTDIALEKIGRSRDVRMSTPYFSGLCRSVSQSDFIGLLPRQFYDQAQIRDGLDWFQAPVIIPPVALYMIWHKRATNTPLHRWMREQIADILVLLNAEQDPLDAH